MIATIQKRNPGPAPRPLSQRFWGKVRKSDGCWLWTGNITNRGYGTIWVNEHGKKELAHRAAWFLETGQWPTAQILHRCDTPACVRHDHHFQGAQADNMADMWRKGRGKGWSYNARKTHCPSGHPYSGDNLIIWHHPRGYAFRKCRECGRIRRRVANPHDLKASAA